MGFCHWEFSEEAESELVKRAGKRRAGQRKNFSKRNIKLILEVPGLASTQVLFSARPRRFLKEISNIYLEHRKYSENSSLDAYSAENTACCSSIKYY